MSSGLIFGDIIMNLFSDITKQTTDSVKNDLFSKLQDDIIYLYKGYLQYYLWKQIADTKTTLLSHHIIEKYTLRKYLSNMLSIDIDEADL